MRIKKVDLAWAAGFFDGEGSIGIRNTKNPLRPKAKTLSLQIGQSGESRSLRAWTKIVGYGNVLGPYKGKGNRLPIYKVDIINLNAKITLEKLLPYLRTKRFVQAKKLIKDWLNYQKHKAHSWDYVKGRIR